ncbi:MAG TPA: hypothetical protein VFC45_02795 [Pseudolabrys sp.]|nr:hypothetical protein [Pseudolabrys sp.]
MKKILLATVCAAFAFVPSFASADTVTPFGDTTGTGPWNLTSVGFSTFGGLDVALSSPINFSALSTLSVGFTDNTGGADGGSPRLVISATNGDFFIAYLGTPPNFNDSDPATFTSSFSGLNLNNATNNSAIGNSGTYQTLASIEALFGTDLINDVQLQVDGGWAINGTQNITVSSLDINGTNYTTNTTPLPAALPLFASGLGVMGFLVKRRKRKVAALAA